jgi:hypothetical protein
MSLDNVRPVMRVSPDQIRILDDGGLRDLMQRLLEAEGRLCGVPASEIVVSDNLKAADAGCDGWSPAHVGRIDWMPGVETCWQLKSGSAGEPARLRGEVLKPIPRRTLTGGGAYVIVASQASGKPQAEARLDVLREEAREAGLPADRIRVYTCESLAVWCNSIPAVAARVAGLPPGLILYDEWARDELLDNPYHAGEQTAKRLEQARAGLDFAGGQVSHLHIVGHPGVGRTRFALEVVRDPALRAFAVYAPRVDEAVIDALGRARGDPAARMLVVVDQATEDAIGPLNQQVRLAGGRVRLVTIGEAPPDDAQGIEVVALTRLDPQEMGEVVRRQVPGLPFEHVDFVVRFADGYVKLARIVWSALREAPDVQGFELLLREGNIRGLLGRLLGGVEDEVVGSLQVVAIMARVGWEAEVEAEGRAIAEHLGLGWREVRRDVHRVHMRLGIAPLAGRFRFISPYPLALHLAHDALELYAQDMPRLPAVLPTQGARNAFFKRVGELAGQPAATRICRATLDRYTTLSNFMDPGSARIWAHVALADPERAVRDLRAALDRATPEERRAFAEDRVEAIWTLEKVAWHREMFADVMLILAELSVAAPPPLDQNLARKFCERFQVVLGGTTVPYLERLPVLDELLRRPEPAYRRLVVQALARACHVGDTRPGGYEDQNLVIVEPEWHPRAEEEIRVRQEAMGRLSGLAKAGGADIEGTLVASATRALALNRGLALKKIGSLMSAVSALVKAVVRAYPSRREELRETVVLHLRALDGEGESKDGHTYQGLQELREAITDHTLEGRLRQYVGHQRWDSTSFLPSLVQLVEEFTRRPELVGLHIGWLTSGEARYAWELGGSWGSATRAARSWSGWIDGRGAGQTSGSRPPTC